MIQIEKIIAFMKMNVSFTVSTVSACMRIQTDRNDKRGDKKDNLLTEVTKQSILLYSV